MKTISVSPPNSVILVMDITAGEVPELMRGAVVQATSTCIAIGTLSEYDGQTIIMLGNSAQLAPELVSFTFDIDVPTGALGVYDVYGNELLATGVAPGPARIQLRLDDGNEPGHIEIAVMPAPGGDGSSQVAIHHIPSIT